MPPIRGHRGLRGVAQGAPVDQPRRAEMPGDGDVLGDIEIGEEGEILVDDLDADTRSTARGSGAGTHGPR